MRKRTGGIIFIVFVIAFIGSYYTVPTFKIFVDANTALVTSLGVLIGVFLWWYSNQSEKKIREETLENKITTILSPISSLCLGRDTELSQLEKDLKHKNILLIKGIAGIGKTTLGIKFRDKLKEKGYQTFWHQFDSQSYEGFLLELSEYLKDRGSLSAVHLKDQKIVPEERLKIAVRELCNYPTVVFLDNFQVFEDDSDFKIFTDYLRNSHLVIMSRTQPNFLSEDYENLEYLDRDSSIELLRTLNVKESQEVLEKIYEKTWGHPWSLMCFKELSRVLPVRNLLDELPDFSREQQTYIFEQCWKHLDDSERDFLMRDSVFRKPLNFDALRVCSKAGLSEILISLAESFYVIKRGDNYYIHDIIKDFAFLKLKEDQKLYIEAQREAAGYYQKSLSAENLLLIYHHLREAGDNREAVDFLMENIDYFWREGFWSDVRAILDESLDFFKDEGTVAHIYSNLGMTVHRLGHWDKAIEYFRKSLEIKVKAGDIRGMAQTYNNLGLVYADKGEWNKAIEYYEKSLEISEKFDDTYCKANVCGNLGSIYYRKGEWDKAIEYYEKSLKIFKKLGNVREIALAYNNLGSFYADTGEWNKAIEYYERSLEIKWGLRDFHGMASTYNNLGLVYAENGKWNKAIEYYEKSLEILKDFGDIYGTAQIYNNLGEIYADKGEWNKAIEYYEKDLEISKELGDIHGMAVTKCNIANMFRNRQEFSDALELYLESENILRKIGDKFNLMKLYYNLSVCCSDMWEKGSNEYFKKAEELRKQLGIETPSAIEISEVRTDQRSLTL